MSIKKLFIFVTAFSGGFLPFALAEMKSENRIQQSQNAPHVGPHAKLSFEKGAATLTDSEKSSLRKMVEDARMRGAIDKITVVAWSDKALPPEGHKLSDADRKIASQRADAIRDYLKSVAEGTNVDTYNMAESAHWFARTFHTRDAELKSVFGRTGSEAPITREEFDLVRREGGPRKALAVVEFKPANEGGPSEAPKPNP